MRTWIILACAVIILSSIVIAEGVIINDFKKDSQMYVKEIKNRIESDIVTIDDLECITNAWNKRKDVIYMFVNHNSFSAIESSIAYMHECVAIQNLVQLRFQLITFEKCVESIVESSVFNMSNIF